MSKFRILKTENQTVPPSEWTKITFDDTDFDIGSNFDFENNRYVIPEDGYYFFPVNLALQPITEGKVFLLLLKLNNTSFIGQDTWAGHTLAYGCPIVSPFAFGYFNKDDYIEVFAWQNCAVGRSVRAMTVEAGFCGFKVT